MTTKKTIYEIEKTRYDLQNLLVEALNHYQKHYGMVIEEFEFTRNEDNVILAVTIIDRLGSNENVLP